MARAKNATSNPYTKGASVPTVRFTVRLPLDVNDTFQQGCNGENKSRSEVATRLIMQYNQQVAGAIGAEGETK
jgi:hypothetical protein